ncbi:hypothetical protein MKK63_19610 [Methylobacterium sp. J-088]|uniref:SGNH/GDSL hydrolase family protein n=1 Tax=Methylobacterium sp. J-088 TaxID=2836664 RepID=UPI001FB9B9E8|nr:hypothetical protein [Methylobacterium sp. J-088]MCJ2064897.1 hypothetical protein [Methylobacterium sp. J-088]
MIDNIKILGVGACMIKGTPHKLGFFQMTCGLLAAKGMSVQGKLKSYPGFSSKDARKFVLRDIRYTQPEYVIIQFATTDASVVLRFVNATRSILKKSAEESRLPLAPAAKKRTSHLSTLRWQVQDFISLASSKKINNFDECLAAQSAIMDECFRNSAVPVVLSAFPCGPKHKTRHAALYTQRLRHLVDAKGGIFVDLFESFGVGSKGDMLMADGAHLTEAAHVMVASTIADAIRTHIASACMSGRRIDLPATTVEPVG